MFKLEKKQAKKDPAVKYWNYSDLLSVGFLRNSHSHTHTHFDYTTQCFSVTAAVLLNVRCEKSAIFFEIRSGRHRFIHCLLLFCIQFTARFFFFLFGKCGKENEYRMRASVCFVFIQILMFVADVVVAQHSAIHSDAPIICDCAAYYIIMSLVYNIDNCSCIHKYQRNINMVCWYLWPLSIGCSVLFAQPGVSCFVFVGDSLS